MLEDIVIDTNVLLHAQNPDESRFSDARQLIEQILECTTSLCIDRGFDISPARNQSKIGAEYLDKLQPGSLGFILIVNLVESFRLKQTDRLPPRDISRAINQLIRKPRDRTFLGVSYNSTERMLVSHDYQDFQQAKRVVIRRNFGVKVVDAGACLPELA